LGSPGRVVGEDGPEDGYDGGNLKAANFTSFMKCPVTAETILDWAWNRQVSFNASVSSGIQIDSKSFSDCDPFRFRVDTVNTIAGPGFWGRLWVGEKPTVGFGVGFHSLVGMSGAAPNNFDLLRNLVMNNLKFGAPSIKVETVNGVKVGTWTVSANAKVFGSIDNVLLELQGWLSESPVLYKGMMLSPFELVTRIQVSNYPFNDTQKNLRLSFSSFTEVRAIKNDSRPIGTVNLTLYGSLNWMKNVSGTIYSASVSQNLIHLDAFGVDTKKPVDFYFTLKMDLFRAEMDAYKIAMAKGHIFNETEKIKTKIENFLDEVKKSFSYNRTIKATISDDSVRVESRSREKPSSVNSTSNATYFPAFRLNLRPIPNIRASFVRSNGSDSEIFTYAVGIFRIVEFNSEVSVKDSKSFYQFSEKTPWRRVQVDNVTYDGVLCNKITSSFNTSTGMYVRIDAYIATSEVAKSEIETLSPSKLKYTIEIGNFPYNLTDSSLALVKGVWAKTKPTFQSSSNTSAEFGKMGSFKWIRQASIDGSDSAVNVEVLGNSSMSASLGETRNGEMVEFMAFKFVASQPSSVIWDPETGVAPDEIVATDTTDPAPVPPPADKSPIEVIINDGMRLTVGLVTFIPIARILCAF